MGNGKTLFCFNKQWWFSPCSLPLPFFIGPVQTHLGWIKMQNSEVKIHLDQNQRIFLHLCYRIFYVNNNMKRSECAWRKNEDRILKVNLIEVDGSRIHENILSKCHSEKQMNFKTAYRSRALKSCGFYVNQALFLQRSQYISLHFYVVKSLKNHSAALNTERLFSGRLQ